MKHTSKTIIDCLAKHSAEIGDYKVTDHEKNKAKALELLSDLFAGEIEIPDETEISTASECSCNQYQMPEMPGYGHMLKEYAQDPPAWITRKKHTIREIKPVGIIQVAKTIADVTDDIEELLLKDRASHDEYEDHAQYKIIKVMRPKYVLDISRNKDVAEFQNVKWCTNKEAVKYFTRTINNIDECLFEYLTTGLISSMNLEILIGVSYAFGDGSIDTKKMEKSYLIKSLLDWAITTSSQEPKDAVIESRRNPLLVQYMLNEKIKILKNSKTDSYKSLADLGNPNG